MKGKVMTILFTGLIAIGLAAATTACKSGEPEFPEVSAEAKAAAEAATAANADNPFFHPYGTPFNVPPFDRIETMHFLPAIEEGIRREQAEVDAI
ncbi:MAG: peptidase M3, partial [Candidatus Aminicenantes bacterium]|nr:peptidase M3 [Candidatus Aminicenantes bacterium]